MHGYLRFKHPHGRAIIKSNDVFRQEIDRWFRFLAEGDGPNNRTMFVDLFFKGGHTFDTVNMFAPYDDDVQAPFATAALSSTGEIMRSRWKGTLFFDDFPDSVTRIALALGRVGVEQSTSSGAPSPDGIASVTDFAQNQIGSTYGHPINRRAFFPETAISPTGFGKVTMSGTLALADNEEGHYIYGAQVIEDGDDGSGTGAEYMFWRRPYFMGAFEAESAETDFLGSFSGTFRWPAAVNKRAVLNAEKMIPDTVGTPAEVPHQNGYPTVDAQTNSTACGMADMVCDELSPARMWYISVDGEFTDGNGTPALASRSRALWSWDRMSGTPPIRRDANDQKVSGALTGFPAFAINVQFRSLAVGRGGFIYLAADGDDDESRGSDNGGLVQINCNTNAVVDVHGVAVSGIYTVGGTFQNNCLAVAVDRTGLRAVSSAYDRVWVLHRNGLSYADFHGTTGVIDAAGWTTVAETASGADTELASMAGSVRGIACFQTGASVTGSDLNVSPPMLGTDHNGDVFWVSTSGTEWDTGKQRLNRLLGDVSAHAYYTLDNVAEGGALGYIELGDTNIGTGSTGTCGTFRMRLSDPGDPWGSDIWLACARGGSTDKIIWRIPTDDFGVAANNIGAHWIASNVFSSFTGTLHVRLWVTPDGQAHAEISNNQRWAIMESREVSAAVITLSGQIDSFGTPGGGLQALVRDTGSGNAWTADLVGKRIRIPGPSSNGNRGSFIVDSFTDGDNITIRNSRAGAAAEGPAAAVAWDNAGAEFEDIGINAVNFFRFDNQHPGWPRGDDSGLGFFWRPRDGINAAHHGLYAGMRVHYMWSGSEWFRRALPHPEAAYDYTRTASTSPVALKSGVTVEFLNQNAGTGEFVSGEYYTCGVSTGIIKDPTQELTINYDFYSEQTDLITSEASTQKTASDGPLAGFRNTEDLGVNPPASTAMTFNNLQLGHYQRRIELDGLNNTTAVQATGTRNATNGFSVGVDLGSSIAIDRIMFASESTDVDSWADLRADLYYSDDNITYTLADSYDPTSDHPEWLLYPDAFRDSAIALETYLAAVINEIEIDVGLIGGAATSPHRYWKLVIYTGGGAATATQTLTGFTCITAAGAAAGFPADNKLGTADDPNYLANFVQRAVWEQDSGTGSAARGPADNQVTLTADTFDSVATDDFFRILSGPEAGFEAKIDTVDSTTQITLVRDAPSFSGVDWEVVRNVDVRPRDDEGGSEDQARFPSAASEVFICPVTGYIFYHADDVTASRVMRVLEYVKVKRAL